MNFLHFEVDTDNGDVIEVTLTGQANVRVMDGTNFASYRSAGRHRAIGGLAKRSPIRLRAPRAGRWYVVVDLAGYGGRVQAAVRVLRGA